MKQYITGSQFISLKEEHQEIINKWMTEKGYYPLLRTGDTHMSIGQLIEFLDEQEFFDNSEHEAIIKDGELWAFLYRAYEDKMKHPSNKELADLLWEACKEISEKND